MPARSGFTLITASQIYGNLLGQMLPTGQVQFTPVNNSGQPISFRVGGGGNGQMVHTPISFPLVAGVLMPDSSGIAPQLPDTLLTFPLNVGYLVSVIDPNTGLNLLGPGYIIQPTGATFSLDTFEPSLGTLATIQTGPPGPAGSGGGGGVGQFAIAETFTGVQTIRVAHNLGILGPLVVFTVTSGAVGFSATPIDENHTDITSYAGSMAGTLLFVGGTAAGVAGSIPVVITQPSAWTGDAGGTITVTAAASGSPLPTVQWQVSTDAGATWANIGGATATTYSVVAAAQNGYQYRAVFSSANGSATTTAASVAIRAGATGKWAMTEGSGGIFGDSVSGNSISVNGSYNWGNWGVPNALAALFNGDGGALANTEPVSLVNGSPWSIKFWGSLGLMPSGAQATLISNCRGSNPLGVEIYIPAGATSLDVVLHGLGGGVAHVSAAAGVVVHTRNLYVVSYDGSGSASGLKIYVDNALQSLTTISDTLGSQSITPVSPAFAVMATWIPDWPYWQNGTNGVMDHLEIDPYLLTLLDVQNFYASGV